MPLKFTREQIEKVLENAKRLVQGGAYSISPRDKNMMFTDEYNLTTDKFKKIFLDIAVEDFHTAEYNNNDRFSPDDVCYIFVPQVMLADVSGDVKHHNVYVKFVFVVRRISDAVIVISFHEAEQSVNYPFR